MNKNTPQGKAVRTGGQTIGGIILAFFIGLWRIEGVSEYVSSQAPLTIISILGLMGVSAGLLSFVQNYFGK